MKTIFACVGTTFLALFALTPVACGSSNGESLFGDGTSGGSAGSAGGAAGAGGGAAGSGGGAAGKGGGGQAGAGQGGASGGGQAGAGQGGSSGGGQAGAGQGGSSGSSGGGQAGGGQAGAGGAAPTGPLCGSQFCSVGDSCCVTTQGTTCYPTNQPQNCFAGEKVSCDGPAACPGQICCGTLIQTPQFSYYSEVTCRATCDANTGGRIICDPNGPACPNNGTCGPSTLLPGYHVCQ